MRPLTHPARQPGPGLRCEYHRDSWKPIIVGHDGSETSRRAVLWAVHHAAATELSLVVLHFWMNMFHPKELGYVPDARDDARRPAPPARSPW
ncbi:universal stress protein [Arthrobacter sp. Ld5]|uniref:universal stress protein n=1 Tax=Arthrobacter sp. Ld5 TaxID=649152 RepID=UPI003EBC4143